MRKLMLAMVAVGVVAIAAVVPVARAADFRGGEQATVKEGETVNGSLFMAGQTVDIDGTVNGDLFCAGNNVTIMGTVKGDVICAGQSVTVQGTVTGDIRVAGNTVLISAKTGGNVSAAGQTVTYKAEARATDVSVAGDSLALAGTVSRDLALAGNSADVTGTVGRNVQAEVERLYFGHKAHVAGQVTYKSDRDADVASGAQVPHRQRQPLDHRDQAAVPAVLAGIGVFWTLLGVVTAMVLAAVAPRLFMSVSDRGLAQPSQTVLAGLVTVFGGMVLLVALAISVVGLHLALVAFIGWLLLAMLAGPAFSFYLGRLLLARNTDHVLLYMLAGALLVFVISLVPVVGALIGVAGGIFGTGMIALEVLHRWPKPHYRLGSKHNK